MLKIDDYLDTGSAVTSWTASHLPSDILLTFTVAAVTVKGTGERSNDLEASTLIGGENNCTSH